VSAHVVGRPVRDQGITRGVHGRGGRRV